jgi:hypothetical protein
VSSQVFFITRRVINLGSNPVSGVEATFINRFKPDLTHSFRMGKDIVYHSGNIRGIVINGLYVEAASEDLTDWIRF